MCADAVIVVEAVRRTSGFFMNFVTQFRVHACGVQVLNTLFQENDDSMTIRQTCNNFYFKAVSEQYL